MSLREELIKNWRSNPDGPEHWTGIMLETFSGQPVIEWFDEILQHMNELKYLPMKLLTDVEAVLRKVRAEEESGLAVGKRI